MATDRNELSSREFKAALAAEMQITSVVIWEVDGIPVNIVLGTDPQEMFEGFAANQEFKHVYADQAREGKHISCTVHVVKKHSDPGLPPLITSFAKGIVAWTMNAENVPEVKRGATQEQAMKLASEVVEPDSKPTNGNGNGKKSTAKKSTSKKSTTKRSTAKKTGAKKSTSKKTTARKSTGKKQTTAQKRTPAARRRATTRRR